jgi:hypothetical protein
MKGKERLNVIFADIAAIAKLQPIIFITMTFGVVYGLATAAISLSKLSFYIGITGSYGFILGISKFFALRKYRLAQTEENEDTLKKIETDTVKNIAVCATVMSFLHFSFAIVSTFFYDEDPKIYSLWFIVFIAGMTFIKIILNLVQSVRTRKNHSVIIHHIKLADTANSLIALALLQRSILYFKSYPHAKLVSGIGGVFFSLCAFSICWYMYDNYKKRKSRETTAV